MSPGEVGYSGRRRVVVVGHDVLAATRRVQWHAARLPPHERVPQPRVCGFPCRFARHAHDTLRVCQQEPKSAPGSGSEKCTNRGASEWRGGEAVGRAGAALGRRAPAGRGGRGLVLARPLSPKACAELAGVSYHTILRAIRSGHPRAFHPPGTTIYRVAPEDFHDWLYGAPVASRPSSRPQRARTLRTGTPMRVASRPHGHRERGGSERERGYPAAGRQASSALARRHRAMVSALAYGGLRPEEMLALIWADVRPEALIVERALARGELRGDDLRKRHNRVVRLLARLAKDLAEWRLACGRPSEATLVFPRADGGPWRDHDWRNWRRRVYQPVARAVRLEAPRPYDLRGSFVSLLIQENRTVVDVAAQAGHTAETCLRQYARLFRDAPAEPVPAEVAIRQAREALRRAGADAAPRSSCSGPEALCRTRTDDPFLTMVVGKVAALWPGSQCACTQLQFAPCRSRQRRAGFGTLRYPVGTRRREPPDRASRPTRGRRRPGATAARSCQSRQSTAIANALQISRILTSASRPSRSTRTATETLSTESRLTAQR
jgi:integrase